MASHKYPLITQKKTDYEFFKKALELIKNKQHLTKDGFNKIVALRASMNKGLPENLKVIFSGEAYISPLARPLVKPTDALNPYWVAGFTLFFYYFSSFSAMLACTHAKRIK